MSACKSLGYSPGKRWNWKKKCWEVQLDEKELDALIDKTLEQEDGGSEEQWAKIDELLAEKYRDKGDEVTEGTEEDVLVDLTKDPPEGIHCSLCGAKPKDAKLCAVSKNNNVVPFGTEGSYIECLNTADCKDRRQGKWSKDKEVGRTNYYDGKQYEMTQWVPKCRHEATEAFSIGDMHFFGGSEEKITKQVFDKNKWLVVSLLGRSKSDPIWCRVKTWADQLKPYVSTAQITIDWTDMSAPPVQPGFWARLVALAKKEKFTNILFYCIGGHGRTGTALASTLIECADVVPSEAVAFIRKYYCKEAIETQSQVDYLIKVGEAAGLVTAAAKKATPDKSNKKGSKK